MKKAFTYFLKDRVKNIILITFVAVLMTLIWTHSSNGISVDHGFGTKYIATFSNIPIATVCAIVATIIPLMEFSFKMKKVNVDHYYALPIDRSDLYYSKFFVGLLTLLIAVTSCFITILLYYLFSIDIVMFNGWGFLLLYASLLISSIIIYIFVTYFYLICNSVLDGVIVVILASCAIPFFCSSFIQTYLEIQTQYGDFSFLFPYSPMTFLPIIAGKIINYTTHIDSTYYQDYYIPASIVGLTINLIITICCMLGIIRYIKKHKAEDSSQITNHFLAYKSLIPFYCVLSLCTVYGSYQSVLISVSIILISVYIVMCIYKRRVILEKKDWINLCIYFLIGIALPFAKAIFEQVTLLINK